MDEAMEKIGGAYTYTTASLLGDKRSTMLENEMHIKARTGKVKERGYVCYPGKYYEYGLPYIRDGQTVCGALQGWPDLPVCVMKTSHNVRMSERERDFTALNRGAVDMGLVTTDDFKAYRSMYNKFSSPPVTNESVRRAPLIFPPDMIFGLPTRPSTPMFEILENRYQKCWIQSRLMDYVEHQKNHTTSTTAPPPPRSYKDTHTSRMRKFKEPSDPRPLWHMPRFCKHAEPHLDTFRTEVERRDAFESAKLDCVPRHGRFEVYRQGLRRPAQS